MRIGDVLRQEDIEPTFEEGSGSRVTATIPDDAAQRSQLTLH
jgi:hypothetical protein